MLNVTWAFGKKTFYISIKLNISKIITKTQKITKTEIASHECKSIKHINAYGENLK